MLLIGTEVKPFKANAYHNGEFIQVTDESLKGKWSVVCFYPADFTFVCPTELEDLQNQYATLKDLGVEVYSVSTDTHFTHKAWHDSSETIGKIEYIMIGDPTRTITNLQRFNGRRRSCCSWYIHHRSRRRYPIYGNQC